jgi:hypothetical protein
MKPTPSESDSLDDLWDSLFHGCAWAAFFDQAAEEQGWPDSEKTRKRAYRYYEDELAKRNRYQGGKESQQQPLYTLAGLTEQCGLSAPGTEEDRAWLDAPPVGRESMG